MPQSSGSADYSPIAAASATRLDEIASRYSSSALRAAAALARARAELLAGAVGSAVRSAGAAVALWSDLAAPFEAAQARLVLAQAHRASASEATAELELRAAVAEFESFGAELRAAQARELLGETADPMPLPVPSEAVFELAGDCRRIRYAGREVLIPDLKGFRYLGRLLADPGRELHVLDLVGREAGGVAAVRTVEGSGLPVMDETARAAYRRRLVEVEDDLAEATAMNDLGRIELAERDRRYLIAELTAAAGLGGRTRATGSTVERARTSVTRSLRYAIHRLSEQLPEIGHHLSGAVRTGIWCRYEPDPLAPIRWRLR